MEKLLNQLDFLKSIADRLDKTERFLWNCASEKGETDPDMALFRHGSSELSITKMVLETKIKELELIGNEMSEWADEIQKQQTENNMSIADEELPF